MADITDRNRSCPRDDC